MSKLEHRYFGVQFRSEGSAKRIVGRAASYGVRSQDFGGWKEVIQRGAFADVLKRGADCYALMNHDPSKILGRTTSGTLNLRDSDEGLEFMLNLPDTALGQEVGELCARGDLNQCSFAFTVNEDGESWESDVDDEDEDEQRSKIALRTLRTISTLRDISLVTYPAYASGTSATAVRSCFPQGIPEQVAQHIAPKVDAGRGRRDLLRKILS